jgi:hypothetical protein
VNPIATYYVFDHLERLREEAAHERRSHPVDLRPTRLRRVVAAVASVFSQARSAGAAAA